MDGRPVLSCQMLAAECEGTSIQTVEAHNAEYARQKAEYDRQQAELKAEEDFWKAGKK